MAPAPLRLMGTPVASAFAWLWRDKRSFVRVCGAGFTGCLSVHLMGRHWLSHGHTHVGAGRTIRASGRIVT